MDKFIIPKYLAIIPDCNCRLSKSKGIGFSLGYSKAGNYERIKPVKNWRNG